MGTIIPESGRNEPRGSDVTDYTVDDAGDFIERLRNRRRLHGLTREQAWSWIAGRIGVGPGTIETLARRRAKRPIEGMGRKLRGLLVRELEAEIERLTHELEMVRARRDGADPIALGEIEAHIAKATALLSEGRSS